jgi:uncharacterized membrane protein YdbT with pleckstrin-like domain
MNDQQLGSVTADEVTIFGNAQARIAAQPEPVSVVADLPMQAHVSQYVADQIHEYPAEQVEQVAAAQVMLDTLHPPAAVQDLPQQVHVESVKLRPSASLLILRLLGIGGVILLILILAGFFFNVLYAVLGGPISSFLDNRMLLMSIGLIVYMAIGFVIYKQWASISYTVYATHIHVERGWIIRNRKDLQMSQFGGANVEQSLVGRVLQYGSIRLLYNGAVGKLVGERIEDIADPFENYKMIMSLIRTE